VIYFSFNLTYWLVFCDLPPFNHFAFHSEVVASLRLAADPISQWFVLKGLLTLRTPMDSVVTFSSSTGPPLPEGKQSPSASLISWPFYPPPCFFPHLFEVCSPNQKRKPRGKIFTPTRLSPPDVRHSFFPICKMNATGQRGLFGPPALILQVSKLSVSFPSPTLPPPHTPPFQFLRQYSAVPRNFGVLTDSRCVLDALAFSPCQFTTSIPVFRFTVEQPLSYWLPCFLQPSSKSLPEIA